MWHKIPSFFKDFYFLISSCFLLWMFLFDSSDLFTQYHLNQKLQNLKKEKKFYLKGVKKLKKASEALVNNPEAGERFARENYLMKKEKEDVYIVVEE